MMWIGWFCIFNPFLLPLNWIPIIGLLGRLALGFITFFIALVFTLLFIAIGYLLYRPLWGLLLLTVVIGIIMLVNYITFKDYR